MKNKTVIILRGTSSSGKSFATSALTSRIGWVSVSADYYFYDAAGNYNWVASDLGKAHQSCKDEFVAYLNDPRTTGIVVDNTNTKESEFSWYEKTAKEKGADVIFFVVEKRHESVNKHNVPSEVIDRHATNITNTLKLK